MWCLGFGWVGAALRRPRSGQAGPSGAKWDRVGPSGAKWGLAGPSGAKLGQVGPSGAAFHPALPAWAQSGMMGQLLDLRTELAKERLAHEGTRRRLAATVVREQKMKAQVVTVTLRRSL